MIRPRVIDDPITPVETDRVGSNETTDWVVVDNNNTSANLDDDNDDDDQRIRLTDGNDSVDIQSSFSPMSTSEDASMTTSKLPSVPPPLPAKRQRNSGPLPPPGLPPKPPGGGGNGGHSPPGSINNGEIDVPLRRRPLIVADPTGGCRPTSQQFTSTTTGKYW
jgi:hypothetical protein